MALEDNHDLTLHLPPELLARIFLLVGRPMLPLHNPSSIPSCMLVNTHWHSIYTSTPSLWSMICIQYFTTPTSLSRALQRSKSHPLDIFFTYPLPLSPKIESAAWELIDILVPHMSRCRSIKAEGRGFALVSSLLKRSTSTSTTRLRSLDLMDNTSAQSPWTTLDNVWMQTITLLQLSRSRRFFPKGCVFPSVHTLILQHTELNDNDILNGISIHFPSLKHLKLDSLKRVENGELSSPTVATPPDTPLPLGSPLPSTIRSLFTDAFTSKSLVSHLLTRSSTITSIHVVLPLNRTYLEIEKQLSPLPSCSSFSSETYPSLTSIVFTIKYHYTSGVSLSNELVKWAKKMPNVKYIVLKGARVQVEDDLLHFNKFKPFFQWLAFTSTEEEGDKTGGNDRCPLLDKLLIERLPVDWMAVKEMWEVRRLRGDSGTRTLKVKMEECPGVENKILTTDAYQSERRDWMMPECMCIQEFNWQ